MSKKQTIKKIQALEADLRALQLESLLTGNAYNLDETFQNRYTTYDSQVFETYQKYNVKSQYGNQQTRMVVDMRTAFIAGEGISVIAKNKKTEEWVNKFLDKNKLYGSRFYNNVKAGEIAGKSLLILKYDNIQRMVKVGRVPYSAAVQVTGLNQSQSNKNGINYQVVLSDRFDPDTIVDIVYQENGETKSLGLRNFVYVKIGGDDTSVNETTTKVGSVLTQLENYDRALTDIRETNHLCARVTPTIQTETGSAAGSILDRLKEKKWKIGDLFAGTGKFDYKVPGTGATDMMAREIAILAKTISGVTSIPVHWMGHVDLMSNRATAEELYESINNGTIIERTIWSESIRDLVLKAQEIYINNGGPELDLIDEEFEIKIPLISFTRFEQTVKALSMAYTDGAISIEHYRNSLPGVNPAEEAKLIEEKEQADFEKMKSVLDTEEPQEDEDVGREEDERN